MFRHRWHAVLVHRTTGKHVPLTHVRFRRQTKAVRWALAMNQTMHRLHREQHDGEQAPFNFAWEKIPP